MNVVLAKDALSLVMIDEATISKIQEHSLKTSQIGEFFSLKINHTQYWLNKLKNNELWTDKGGYLAMLDNETKTIFGVIWHFSHNIPYSYEIGINILIPEYRGKGFATQALIIYSNYLFQVYPINRVQYNMIEENQASEKVAQKAGFKYEGLQRCALFIRGHWHNLKLYSKLREEVSHAF